MSPPHTPRSEAPSDECERTSSRSEHSDEQSTRRFESRTRRLGSRTRRDVLAGGATAAAGALAGCLAGLRDSTDDAGFRPDDLPTVEDPPDAVYVPSHREAMAMLGSVEVGDYVVGAMLSYPHEFWTVTDEATELVEVQSSDGAHLMATVADAETGAVIPTDEGVTLHVRKDGDLVEERSPWSMLSQGMGFHFGDNVPLDGDGSYELEVELPAPSVRATGAFDGRFESFETATVEFEFTQELRDSLVEDVQYVDESVRGQRGAIEPMGHGGMDGGGASSDDGEGMDGDGAMDGGGMHNDGMHGASTTSLPAPEELPGQLQHTAEDVPRSHDADVAVAVVDGFHGRSPYLLVSPRTPYNAYPLPEMTLTATVERDGEPVVDGAELVATVDPEASFHYGRELDVAPGDELTVGVDAPPQIARHQGYETAFLEMDDVALALEGW